MKIKLAWVTVTAMFYVCMAFGDQDYLSHRDLIFPQVAAGGVAPHYETWITVTNRGAEIYTGTLNFYTAAGAAWNPYVNGYQITLGSLPVNIGSGVAATFKITSPGSTEAGYATIRAEGRETLTSFLEGNLTYYVDSNADSVGIAPSKPFTVSVLPFEDFNSICLALVNTNSAQNVASITLKLYSAAGTLAGTRSLNLTAKGYNAQYLWQLFSSVERSFGRGRLEISSDTLISGIALTQISTGQLSSLPLGSTLYEYFISLNSPIQLSGLPFEIQKLDLWMAGPSFIHGILYARISGADTYYYMNGYANNGVLTLYAATNDTTVVMPLKSSDYLLPGQPTFGGQYSIVVPATNNVQTSLFSATRIR